MSEHTPPETNLEPETDLEEIPEEIPEGDQLEGEAADREAHPASAGFGVTRKFPAGPAYTGADR